MNSGKRVLQIEDGYGGDKTNDPQVISEHDVVLTTYRVTPYVVYDIHSVYVIRSNKWVGSGQSDGFRTSRNKEILFMP
ncbi:hypothetical protein V6N13_054947 [Hibiscus sabdariffa]